MDTRNRERSREFYADSERGRAICFDYVAPTVYTLKASYAKGQGMQDRLVILPMEMRKRFSGSSVRSPRLLLLRYEKRGRLGKDPLPMPNRQIVTALE